MSIDISVIIPVYKGQKYIDYWIDILSVNFNKYFEHFNEQCEVIFVNDWPKERIIVEKEVPYVRVFNLEANQGIHGARVFGYCQSKGRYIVFIDQDDEISEDYLVRQRECIGSADAVVCNSYWEKTFMMGKSLFYTSEDQYIDATILNKYIWTGNQIITPGQVLIKKSSIPELWLNNIMTVNGADDYFLWLLMLKDSCSFNVNRKPLFTHVEHGYNASKDVENMARSVAEMTGILRDNCILEENELNEIEAREWRKCEKNDNQERIIKTYNYWIHLNNRNINLETYLHSKGYDRIAIYGMGYMGDRLYETLVDSSVEVVFLIDKRADTIVYDIPVISPDSDELKEYVDTIDAIVVTAIISYQQIYEKMRGICDKPIVSMEKMLLELVDTADLY